MPCALAAANCNHSRPTLPYPRPGRWSRRELWHDRCRHLSYILYLFSVSHFSQPSPFFVFTTTYIIFYNVRTHTTEPSIFFFFLPYLLRCVHVIVGLYLADISRDDDNTNRPNTWDGAVARPKVRESKAHPRRPETVISSSGPLQAAGSSKLWCSLCAVPKNTGHDSRALSQTVIT